MNYVFPPFLKPLRDFLRDQGADITAFKTDRQAAFIAQQLVGSRIKFPPAGGDMTSTLLRIQEVVVAGKSASSSPSPKNFNNAQPAAKNKNAKETRKRERNATRVVRPKPQLENSSDFDAGLVIFTDGACEPNPGPGGWAFAVYRDGIEIHSASGFASATTNNAMEMTAVLHGLMWFADRNTVEPVRILSDSQYVVNGCNDWRHKWKKNGWSRRGQNSPKRDTAGEVKNLHLWQELDAALTLVPIKLEWVRGHDGIAGNERADELCALAIAVQTEDHSLDPLEAEYRSIMRADD